MEINTINLDTSVTKTVEITPQQSFSFFSIFFAMLTLVLIPVLVFFGLGFLVGRYQVANSTSTGVVQKVGSTASTKGKNLFSDIQAGYSIYYPDNWKATKHNVGIPGVILENQGTSIEIWIGVDQPLTLSAEQKAGIDQTNKPSLTVAGQKATVTEYVYKSGNYFTIIVIPASDQKGQVTFWVKAEDKTSYTEAKDIIQTFQY